MMDPPIIEFPDDRMIEEAITNWWGVRCDEFEPNCPCCKAWAEFDRRVRPD